MRRLAAGALYYLWEQCLDVKEATNLFKNFNRSESFEPFE